MLERRSEPRALAVYRAAYVRSARALNFVTMRNVSDSGAAFHGEVDLRIGERIEYCTGDAAPVQAKVRWIRAGMFGVEDIKEPESVKKRDSKYAPRSVRLPIGCAATIFVDGKRHPSDLVNISLSGACIIAPRPLAPGQLISIEIGDRTFEASTVRWVAQGSVGVRFAKPMCTNEIKALLKTIVTEVTPAMSA